MTTRTATISSFIPGSSGAVRLPAWLSAAALLLALALLLGFYQVTQAAVARAHTHWERAPVARTANLDACLASASDPAARDCQLLR